MKVENTTLKENLKRSLEVLRTDHKFAVDAIKQQYEFKLKEIE